MCAPYHNPPRWPRAPLTLVLGCALSLRPAAAHAQVNPPPHVPVQPVPSQGDTVTRNDYRFEGAMIGGAVTGVPSAVIAASLCEWLQSSPSFGPCALQTVAGLVAGAVPGLLLGGLIGSAIDKPSSRNQDFSWVDSPLGPLGPKLRSVQVTLFSIPIGSP